MRTSMMKYRLETNAKGAKNTFPPEDNSEYDY